ncbi:alkaline phosphatase PafA [Flavobacterium croceum]|uniref:alkaline phosphatase PafA n=1 Tax=Flavobacterium croceum TaxID=370975 RepID=UPI0024A9FA95|nr:alkaline phosphatase PafA [Flavobacterium croceum]
MKKTLLVSLLITQIIFSQKRPKLVVGIVVDQMRMEYLYRFQNDFSNDGFKRIMNNGFTFHNAHYNYMPTYTAPGHASIYTGTTPSVHGIVSNEWYSRTNEKERYCTDDEAVTTLGDGTKQEGAMSPKNLLATTITDELRMATNFQGKVIGISIKDRGAILPAGHFANWAFWYSKTGNFISSSFYGDKLPEWVTSFNAKKKYLDYINQGWNLYKPLETYNESDPDDSPYEGKLYGVDKPVFPYDLKSMYQKNDAGVLRNTPFGNSLLADFAKEAIEKENLGKDEVTDFLAISFSSTDYVGHVLGARSMELQDTYLRLDDTLADLLKYLDEKVGKNNYLLFLTADHACAENSMFLKNKKYNVTNIDYKEVSKSLKKFSTDTFGEDFVNNYSSFNVFLNKKKIKEKGLVYQDVEQAFKNYLMTREHVQRVYNEDEILHACNNDFYLNMIANGYDVTQNGELVLLDKPGYMQYMATGTSHGSPYAYDTHAPLLFYGWNIPKGESHTKKYITQIAPTLAQKINITFPNGTKCEVLDELFKK